MKDKYQVVPQTTAAKKPAKAEVSDAAPGRRTPRSSLKARSEY
jgi:hypothetical protein